MNSLSIKSRLAYFEATIVTILLVQFKRLTSWLTREDGEAEPPRRSGILPFDVVVAGSKRQPLSWRETGLIMTKTGSMLRDKPSHYSTPMVAHMMTPGVVQVPGDVSVSEAALLLDRERIPCLLVKDSDTSFGIMTSGDIVKKVVAQGLEAARCGSSVHYVETRPFDRMRSDSGRCDERDGLHRSLPPHRDERRAARGHFDCEGPCAGPEAMRDLPPSYATCDKW